MSKERSITGNLKKLTAVKKGDSVLQVASAERINAIQETLKAMARGENVVAGVNIRKTLGEGFFILSGQRGGRGGGGGEATLHFPWEITVVNVSEDPETPDWRVKVKPGTINQIIPSNMFSDWAVAATGTYYVTLDCTSDGDTITDVIIDGNSDIPPDLIGSEENAAPADLSILLGLVVDHVPFQLISDCLDAQTQLTILTLKDTPIAGEPFFDLNYTWKVTAISGVAV